MIEEDLQAKVLEPLIPTEILNHAISEEEKKHSSVDNLSFV
jgi:hypothetical protein